jgi:hypothetical protein
MTKEQFEKITKWQKETFQNATALSKLHHLKEEIDELQSDLERKAFYRNLEFADCFLLLFGCAAADGFTYEAICDSINQKMELNYKRVWGKPDENGVVKHVEIEG